MRLLSLSLAVLILGCAPASAGGIDLHALWDDRCAECHGHSAEFARKFLQVSDGRLQGRHHQQTLRLFLSSHYLPAVAAEAIYDMLLAQTQTPPRFMTECASCHGRAAALVRDSILLGKDSLLGRNSGLRVSEFMRTHRNLKSQDSEFFINLLERVASEIYHP